MTERIAIVGSSSYPSSDDVADYVHQLPADIVIVVDDRPGVGTVARDTATRLGIPAVVHTPNRIRDGDGAAYRQSAAIVDDCDRLIAFVVRDGKTKRVSEGTELRLTLAERKGIPIEIRETPVRAATCDLIARLRRRLDGIKTAPTPAHGAYRVKSAGELLSLLKAEAHRLDTWIREAEAELDDAPESPETERNEETYRRRCLAHDVVQDAVREAEEAFAAAPPYAPPVHRQSMHRAAPMELVACP